MICTAYKAQGGVHDGLRLHPDAMLVVRDGLCDGILSSAPDDAETVDLGAGLICPGFVDLQVNGGGGVMLDGDLDGLRLGQIAAAHHSLGTTALLPTLITDTPVATRHVIDTVIAACRDGQAGIIGLHLEGPHLSVARKGAHDGALIRPMGQDDIAMLCDAAKVLPNLMVTVAAEAVTPGQIRQLVAAGVIVSIGHSDADYDTAMAAFDAGARCTTHLFNAMSGFHHRDPGLVGATLAQGGYAGLIADAVHVHPAAMRMALAAKTGPGHIFLVSDAMAFAGTDLKTMSLGGRDIRCHDGQLTLADGTLAGADLSLPQAIRTMVDQVGITLEAAVAMATGYPVNVLSNPGQAGRITAGKACDVVYLDPIVATAQVIA